MKKILFIGGIIAWFVSASAIAWAVPPDAGEIYELVGEWGSFGSAEGQFWNPTGIAVDADGNVYVADRDNHRIQKFTAEGELVTHWDTWYGPLANLNELRFPSGVAVDSTGNVYVTDRENYRVVKFTADGTFITEWGTEVVPRPDGECDCTNRIEGQFLHPEEIAVDLSGNVYVIDNCSIQKFDAEGQLIRTWEIFWDAVLEVNTGCLKEGDSGGNAIRYGIAPDSLGNVYLIGHLPASDPDIAPLYEGYHLIYQYTSDHEFITKWGSEEENNPPTFPVGEFLNWSGIALDSADNVYAVDRNYAGGKIRIQKFTARGEFLTQWTTDRKDINDDEVTSTGITIDQDGNVYLLNGNSVQKFAVAPPVTTTTTTSSIPGGTTTTTVPPPRTEPKAAFTVKPVTATVSTPFTFDASGCSDKEDPVSDLVVRWDWENDGTWDTEFSTSKIATHQYSKEGIYTVKLEVKDTSGLTDSATRRIIVWAKPRLCAASYLLGKENPRLAVLRNFRDTVLATSTVGITFIELYYKNGEQIIQILEKTPFLKEFARSILTKIISG